MNLYGLDWVILIVGMAAVIWAVWRAVQKDKRMQQGASSADYLFGKGEPGTLSVQQSLLPTLARNTW